MLVIYLLMLQMVVLVIELLLARKLSLGFLRDLYRSCHLTASLIFGYKKNRATTIEFTIEFTQLKTIEWNATFLESLAICHPIKALLPTTKGYVYHSIRQKI